MKQEIGKALLVVFMEPNQKQTAGLRGVSGNAPSEAERTDHETRQI
jgi:hypothetical protein